MRRLWRAWGRLKARLRSHWEQRRVLWLTVIFGAAMVGTSLALWKVPVYQRTQWEQKVLTAQKPKDTEWIDFHRDGAQIEDNARKTLAQILAGLFVLVGLYFAWKRIDVSREDQLTERFSRAIEQLGNGELAVRLGGIHALERVARDSRKDHWAVMEVLTAFVRTHKRPETESPADGTDEEEQGAEAQESFPDAAGNQEKSDQPPAFPPIPGDVVAALTAIGRRKWTAYERAQKDEDGRPKALLLELTGADLREARLGRADLREARLGRADLREARLGRARNLTQGQLDLAKSYEGAVLPDYLKDVKTE